MKREQQIISQELIDGFCSRLEENKPLREALPGGGRIHIDRALPFVCLYRTPPHSDVGTEKLVHGEASYIVASGDADYEEGLTSLIKTIAQKMRERFGAFLLIELWAHEDGKGDTAAPGDVRTPWCRIVAPEAGQLTSTVETLKCTLDRLKVHRRRCQVELEISNTVSPLGLAPVFSPEWMEKMQCYSIGLAVRPVYHDEKGETLYPLDLRALHRGVAKALKKAFFSFTQEQTNAAAAHYNVFGRRSVTKAVWDADSALAEIDDAFDFLLQVTPVNSAEAWKAFKESGYKKTPRFYYRPRPFDPAAVKRQLYAVNLEKIEDPTLLRLFSEKRDELDRKLTMLHDRENANFLYGSLQTYGSVGHDLLQTAERMLKAMPPKDRENIGADSDSATVSAEQFAREAETELAYYKKLYPEMTSNVQLREDIVSGAMVSGGDFLVSKWAHFPAKRVEALLHHEIGTHIVTYVNGTAQPFKQLHTGLSGYDEMQEGIAVLSEYLCGGLNISRLRILAGRVVAANCLVTGASFLDTFTRLHEAYGFKPKTAFTITTRIFLGGGLTEDAGSLRGLLFILDYIAKGGAIEPLYVGKIAANHIPLVEELLYREILSRPPLFPRYLQEPEAAARLKEIQEKKLSIMDIIERSRP
ncbi:MAG: DUF1704 domain-containing protein [Campylobacterales bacterium]